MLRNLMLRGYIIRRLLFKSFKNLRDLNYLIRLANCLVNLLDLFFGLSEIGKFLHKIL